MKSVIYVKLNNEKVYDRLSTFTRITDGFKIKFYNEEFIIDNGIKIKSICIPSNLNEEAYKYNLKRTYNKFRDDYSVLCPSGKRKYDYNFLNEFQKQIVSFSIVESIRLILLKKNKSIKNARIVIDEKSIKEIKYILDELSKEARNVVIITDKPSKVEKLRQYIVSNYGVSIQLAYKYEDVENVDFVISSNRREYSCSEVWYLDDLYTPENQNGLYVNNVGFTVPWKSSIEFYSPELLGGILKKEKNKSIKEIFIKNDIKVEQISFNLKDIVI